MVYDMGVKMTKYKIIDVLHSGRKGIRGTPVEEHKYDQLVGSVIRMYDLEGESIKQFEPLRFNFVDHPLYEIWNTSELLQLAKDKKSGEYIIETVNTIYRLEKLDGNKIES